MNDTAHTARSLVSLRPRALEQATAIRLLQLAARGVCQCHFGDFTRETELAISTGADALSAAELAGALIVLAENTDAGKSQAWAKRGAALAWHPPLRRSVVTGPDAASTVIGFSRPRIHARRESQLVLLGAGEALSRRKASR